LWLVDLGRARDVHQPVRPRQLAFHPPGHVRVRQRRPLFDNPVRPLVGDMSRFVVGAFPGPTSSTGSGTAACVRAANARAGPPPGRSNGTAASAGGPRARRQRAPAARPVAAHGPDAPASASCRSMR
jgi:hypothetical protein